MSLILAPFKWALRRLGRVFSSKGALGILLLAVFLNLDQIFPQLGGKLTTAALVLGPAIAMGFYAQVLSRWDGGPNDFAVLALYMAACGLYGLLRAWSAAAGSDVPDYVASLGLWLFGPLVNLLVGAIAAFFGHDRYAPMPILHPEGLAVQLSELNILLTLVSLFVIGWALAMMNATVRRWGGGAPPLQPEDRARARNRLVPPHRAARRLLGLRRNLVSQIRPILGRPRLALDEFVVGMAPALKNRPWRLPLVLIGRLLIMLGGRPEGTMLDPRPIIAAPFETLALIVGGPGSGKTLIQQANLICGQGPRLLVETQGNAGDKDKPLIEANGRTCLVIAPELGRASAGFNLLERLEPAGETFPGDVERIAGYIIEVRGEHLTLKRCAFELVAAVIANVALLARSQGHVPSLMLVYECLSDPALADYLADWTTEGHPAYRRWCATLAARLSDPEFANSLAAFWSPELSFLADPSKAALICGATEQVFDPAWLLDDPEFDVVVQINQQDLSGSGALLRLLMIGVMAPRIALNMDQAGRTRARGLMLWIDELAALGGSKILDDTVQFYRQKGIRPVYSMQSPKQADELHGPGTYAKWSAAADIRIYAKPGGEQELAEHVSHELGETVRLVRSKMFSGDRGFATNGAEWRPAPLLSRDQLAELPALKVVVLVRTRRRGMVKILCDVPAWFSHPGLRAFRKRALRRHGGLDAKPWGGWPQYKVQALPPKNEDLRRIPNAHASEGDAVPGNPPDRS
ncbi:hypothetical protein DKT77_17825 [Meridianimarinicoccus roseus]|uniref:TraD/TraG TraM recognition site domain-containing protein n=1 Tax=Meridianimarinicoccus roseus TaxID=2072018 RepID=A0A2V2LFU8_9RHOB|nr:TraM recognition domain-containing protein [Meridianimarinicoccus roseus]PWR01289.1 hypothetical protein DKT77_17825 [Meridianimarinicoccus roseus]